MKHGQRMMYLVQQGIDEVLFAQVIPDVDFSVVPIAHTPVLADFRMPTTNEVDVPGLSSKHTLKIGWLFHGDRSLSVCPGVLVDTTRLKPAVNREPGEFLKKTAEPPRTIDAAPL